jgi:hypothetical protein
VKVPVTSQVKFSLAFTLGVGKTLLQDLNVVSGFLLACTLGVSGKVMENIDNLYNNMFITPQCFEKWVCFHLQVEINCVWRLAVSDWLCS